jgi:hypothetical protein
MLPTLPARRDRHLCTCKADQEYTVLLQRCFPEVQTDKLEATSHYSALFDG